MKPNEVMIGDLVNFNDPDTNETELHRISQEDFSGNDKFWNRLSSIEITPEILDANGISIDDDDWFVWEKRSGAYTLAEVKMYQDDDVWKASIFGPNVCEIDDLNIRFVHELQHALRLAGLADLADNFKIMKGCQQ